MLFRQTQLFKAILLLVTTFVISGLGYYVLGYFNPDPNVHWTLFECFYMSTITLTTTGFAETLASMEHFTAARVYTMLVLIFGTGFLVYAASAATAGARRNSRKGSRGQSSTPPRSAASR